MQFRRHYIILLTLVLGAQHFATAQQTPLFPEYDHNPFVINPAYAGMTSGSVSSLSHNRYTKGFDGAPHSSTASHHFPLMDGKIGVGALISDEKVGVTANTSAVAAFSYKLFFEGGRNRSAWRSFDHVFSFGMTAGAQRLYDNLLELGLEDDPEFAINLSETIPVIGAGFLYNKGDFFIGASAPNLLGDRLASRDDIQLSIPVYGYLGYRFYADASQRVFLKPSAMVKYEKGAPVQIDINLSSTLNELVELGVGYRSSSSLNFLVGIYPLEQLRVVYFYNAGLRNNPLGNNHGITASFALGYD